MGKASIRPKPLLYSLHSNANYHRITPKMIRNNPQRIPGTSPPQIGH